MPSLTTTIQLSFSVLRLYISTLAFAYTHSYTSPSDTFTTIAFPHTYYIHRYYCSHRHFFSTNIKHAFQHHCRFHHHWSICCTEKLDSHCFVLVKLDLCCSRVGLCIHELILATHIDKNLVNSTSALPSKPQNLTCAQTSA